MANFTVFDYAFNDEQLEKDFENFFSSNNLDALFTYEHRSSPIKVSYTQAKGVVNKKGDVNGQGIVRKNNGSYVSTLKNFSDVLSLANDNKKFNEATFKVLQRATGFQKMINNMNDVLNEFASVQERHKFNFWNIVFYNKDLF